MDASFARWNISLSRDGTLHGHNRWFSGQVLAHFAFLEDFGFKPVEIRDTFVRYEAQGSRFVNVYYGRSSYELKFEVGRGRESGVVERYYPIDFAKQHGSSEEHYFQASTADRVQQFVPRLAAFLRAHGTDALRGDESAFETLKIIQRGQSDALRLTWALEDARREAREAWLAKDYDRVVQVYAPIADKLMPSERKKLDYARRYREKS
jgi:hypothetical protein